MSRRLGWLTIVAGLLMAGIALLVGLHDDADARAAAVRQASQRDLVDAMHDWTNRDAVGAARADLEAAQGRRETIGFVVAGVGVVLAAIGGVTLATAKPGD